MTVAFHHTIIVALPAPPTQGPFAIVALDHGVFLPCAGAVVTGWKVQGAMPFGTPGRQRLVEGGRMTDVAARAGAASPAARRALAQALADALGETERGPCALLARVVATLGEDRARAFLAETLAVEAAGGFLLPDGSRRRTPGGVFFHLVRRGVDREARRRIFPSGPRQPRWRPPGPGLAPRARWPHAPTARRRPAVRH